MRSFSRSAALGLLTALLLEQNPARGDWQTHQIRQGDGRGGWVTRPALRQVLKHPDANFTMAFGLVQMDNGELALLCSREKTDEKGRTVQAIIAFSKDGGATWSEMQFLFDAGRHHANLQRLPSGDLIAQTVGREGWPKVRDQGIVLKRTVVRRTGRLPRRASRPKQR